MGRHKTPTSVLELHGSFKKNPNRARPNEPKPAGGIGEPPDGLTEAELKTWCLIVSESLPGVLGESDRGAVEIMARLWTEFRTNPSEFPTNRINALINLMARFGMTPADRARLHVTREPEVENPFLTLVSKGR